MPVWIWENQTKSKSPVYCPVYYTVTFNMISTWYRKNVPQSPGLLCEAFLAPSPPSAVSAHLSRRSPDGAAHTFLKHCVWTKKSQRGQVERVYKLKAGGRGKNINDHQCISTGQVTAGTLQFGMG